MHNSPITSLKSDKRTQNTPPINPEYISQHGILLDIPTETLTRITSYLPPPALYELAKTNRYLNGHITGENTWRRAFLYQFMGIPPEADLEHPQVRARTLMLRRRHSTWREEVVSRYRLARRWQRSRNTPTAHTPHSSPLASIHLIPSAPLQQITSNNPTHHIPSPALLSASLPYGVIARSFPLTGRVLNGYLNAHSPVAHGMGVGNPNVEFTPNISSCAVVSSGTTAYVAWGTRVGDVRVLTAPHVMEINRPRRGWEARISRPEDEHQGEVTDVQWVLPVSAVQCVSAAKDGKVKLWSVQNQLRCLWTSRKIMQGPIPEPFVKVVAESMGDSTLVVAVNQNGVIYRWVVADEIEETVIPCPSPEHTVMALHLDHASSILVAYTNDPFFYRVDIGVFKENNNGKGKDADVQITPFGDPSFGATSVVVPYLKQANNETEAERSFILVGDWLGYVSVYHWDATPTPGEHSTVAYVHPMYKFEVYPTSMAPGSYGSTPASSPSAGSLNPFAVTSIAWTPLILAVGLLDGGVGLFDGFEFELVRGFGGGYEPLFGVGTPGRGVGGRGRRARHGGGGGAAAQLNVNVNLNPNANQVGNQPVNQGQTQAQIIQQALTNQAARHIVFSPEMDYVVAGVGERVVGWFAGRVGKEERERRHGWADARERRAGQGRRRRRGGRVDTHSELTQAIWDSADDIGLAPSSSTASVASASSLRDQRLGLDRLGLSEAEAVEYVLMLSREEALAASSSNISADTSSSGNGGYDGDDDEISIGVSTVSESQPGHPFNTSLDLELALEEERRVREEGLFGGDFDPFGFGGGRQHGHAPEIDTQTETGTETEIEPETETESPRQGQSYASSASLSDWFSSASVSSRGEGRRISGRGSMSPLPPSSSTTKSVPYAPRVAPSHSNEKVQVSPPLADEPMMAGGLDGAPVHSQSEAVLLDSGEAFPPISLGGSGSSVSSLGSSGAGSVESLRSFKGKKVVGSLDEGGIRKTKGKGKKGKTGRVKSDEKEQKQVTTKSPSGSASSSPPTPSRSAWSVPLAIRAGSSPAPQSAVSAALRAGTGNTTVPWTRRSPSSPFLLARETTPAGRQKEEMDADLQLALELSLADARRLGIAGGL